MGSDWSSDSMIDRASESAAARPRLSTYDTFDLSDINGKGTSHRSRACRGRRGCSMSTARVAA